MLKAVGKRSIKPQKRDAAPDRVGGGGTPSAHQAEQLPVDLHLSTRPSLSEMAPCDIVFLDEFAHFRGSLASKFVAVLACPVCGSPGLITSVQYSGGAPIVCTSNVCPGLFRIVDESQIVSLPPS